jgi:glycosyltransferase involved in cell wall biosynthesis
MLAQMLREKGHRVTRWAPTFVHASKTYRCHEDRTIRVDDGYEIELLHAGGYVRHVGLRRHLFHTRMARSFVRRAMLLATPDVIVCAQPTPEMCAAAVDCGNNRGVPVVLDVRDLWPDLLVDMLPRPLRPLGHMLLYPARRRNRRVFRRASAVVGISPAYLAWGLRTAGRACRATDRVFPMAHRRIELDPEQRRVAQASWQQRGVTPDGTLRCCFFGTLGHLFDLETIFAAARHLARTGQHAVQFVLCGQGAHWQHYKRMAQRLPNVVFPGWVPRDEVALLMQWSAVGLAPYRSGMPTTYPNKVVDYLSAGLPVLTTTGGELARLVEEEQCGLTYTAGNGDSLLQALERMRANPKRCQAMASRSQELFAKRFDATHVYASMIDYLADIASRRSVLPAHQRRCA